jgi:O-antigen/teichoic acid export membrane protein
LKRAALVGYKAASDVAGKAAFFAVLILAAHRLPTRAFGLFSLSSTLGWILSVATDFGLQMHLARQVARAPDRTASILAPILRLRLRLAAAAMGLACLAFVALPAGDALPFVLIVAAYVFSSLVEFLNYAYRGLSRSDVEATLNMAQRLGTLALAGALLGLAPRFDVLSVALFLPPLAAFAYSARLVRQVAGDAGGGPVRTATAPDGLSRAVFLRDVFPIGAGIVLSALYFRIDLFLVEHWRGVEEVAKYNAVFRLIEALRLFPSAVVAVMLPALFRQPAPRFVWRVSGLLTVFGVAVAAVLYQPAPWLLDVAYGARYVSAVPAFRVLLLAFPLLSLNYGLTHQIIGWDGQRQFAVICGAALVVNLAMNAAWIPSLGITGAAWATLGTEAFLTAACVVVLSLTRSARPPGR